MKTITLSDTQLSAVMTALKDYELRIPKGHPARKNYRELYEYMKWY